MEVLKHGKIYENAVVICEHCGCVFRYDLADTRDSSMFGDSDRAIYVNCPECDKPHILGHKIEWVVSVRKATDQERPERKERE